MTKSCLLCGIALALAGCYSYHPYGGFGGPGMWTAPGPSGTVVPGTIGPGTVVPPNGQTFSAPPGGTFQQPGGTFQQPLEQPTPSTSPGGSSGTPTYDPNATEDPNSVPEYRDPTDPALDPGSGNGGGDVFDGADGGESPFFESRAEPQLAPPRSAETPAAFASSSTVVTEKAPDPFDYDRTGYRWLRGVVYRDQADGTWTIIYDLDPGPQDQFGGAMTLSADRELLGTLNDGDVILVEGAVMPEDPDRFAKPHFQVHQLSGPLVHKSQSS